VNPLTLKELWQSKRLTPTQVAAQAGITTVTLYRMNRRKRVSLKSKVDVCKVLDITMDVYENLEAEKEGGG
jgi:DNA-binding Xre family transcriptional regulator